MRTGADHGRREARYLACGRSDPGPHSRARDAAPPIRCRHAPRRIDDRQDGPNPPSMSAEECTAHQDLQAGHGSTAVVQQWRAVSQNGASPDTLENRRPRWPRRERAPRPRRQDKSNASLGRFAVVGQWVTACRRKGKGGAFPENPIESTRIAPPMGFRVPAPWADQCPRQSCLNLITPCRDGAARPHP